MPQNELVRAAMALGIVYGIYKFVKNDAVKAMALGVGGIVVAKNIPVVKDFV